MNFQLNLSDLIQIVSLMVIAIQLFVVYKSFIADHERRQKQSTIEYVSAIRKEYRIISYKISEKHGDKPINLNEIDEEIEKEIKVLLSSLEYLSVGINTGVYNYEVLKRLSGSFLIYHHYKLLPYIKDVQTSLPTAYIEFEYLCERLINDRHISIKPKKGDIKHSI